MAGYDGWTMERTEIGDATIPILADGIKWIGYSQEKHLVWNLAAFGDTFSEGQTFSSYSHQFVGRIAWLPIENDETVLHLGAATRYGAPLDGMLQLRSRPEAFEAPYFIDTGKFPAKSTQTSQFEAYYRPRSFLIGTEYFVQSVNSPETGNPFFQGGQVVMSWLATGEIRAELLAGASDEDALRLVAQRTLELTRSTTRSNRPAPGVPRTCSGWSSTSWRSPVCSRVAVRGGAAARRPASTPRSDAAPRASPRSRRRTTRRASGRKLSPG
jgi:hypothetical protein